MVAEHPMKNRKLSLQALEYRYMLAGNIFAHLVGIELVVDGDAMDNQVDIENIAGISNPDVVGGLAEARVLDKGLSYEIPTPEVVVGCLMMSLLVGCGGDRLTKLIVMSIPISIPPEA